jgi:hypothetical protein
VSLAFKVGKKRMATKVVTAVVVAAINERLLVTLGTNVNGLNAQSLPS